MGFSPLEPVTGSINDYNPVWCCFAMPTQQRAAGHTDTQYDFKVRQRTTFIQHLQKKTGRHLNLTNMYLMKLRVSATTRQQVDR
jgi:hypothetical protein